MQDKRNLLFVYIQYQNKYYNTKETQNSAENGDKEDAASQPGGCRPRGYRQGSAIRHVHDHRDHAGS